MPDIPDLFILFIYFYLIFFFFFFVGGGVNSGSARVTLSHSN